MAEILLGDMADATANKQTKRLQLRRNGFRGPPVLTDRNMTPASNDHSRSRSRTSSINSQPHHDLRPLQPLNVTQDDEHNSPRRSSFGMGILQQVSNSSQRRKRSSGRPRIDDVAIFEDENSTLSPGKVRSACSDSPTNLSFMSKSPRHGSLPRSASKLLNRTLPSQQRRVSTSSETTKYIEHLESELAAAQSQLTAMTSPAVMQNRSIKMRALNTEVQTLQQELTQWESKYRERVEQEIAERLNIETGLKSKIRSLENDVDSYAQKVKELQSDLEAGAASLTAAENANCELEKRIDAITNLVASPKKNKEPALEREASARKRHSRQRSVLPRFLTTGNLQMPQRSAEPFEPSTPFPQGPEAAMLALTGVTPQAEQPSAITDGHTADPAQRMSVATEYPSNELNAPGSTSSSNRFSWSTPESSINGGDAVVATRPSRRMRRFHGGTMMPKPLLLPCTTTMSYNGYSGSAVADRELTPPPFPFPDLSEIVELPAKRPFDALVSPRAGGNNARKRALTSADGVLMALRRASTPFVASGEENSCASSETSIAPHLASPADLENTGSDKTLRDFSSIGSTIGRNLLEELQRAKHNNRSDMIDESRFSLSFQGSKQALRVVSQTRLCATETSAAIQEGLRRRGRRQRSLSDSDKHANVAYPDEDAKTDLASLFSDMLRNPITAAKHCMIRAHILSTRSATVQKLQWWLLNVLLGPIDARRMMNESVRSRSPSTVGLMHYSDIPGGVENPRLRHERDTRSASPELTICLADPTNTYGSGGTADVGLATQRAINIQRHSFGDSPRFDALFFGRHSLWLWLRFGFTLAFAIGAALRDGPGFVMGIQRLATQA